MLHEFTFFLIKWAEPADLSSSHLPVAPNGKPLETLSLDGPSRLYPGADGCRALIFRLSFHLLIGHRLGLHADIHPVQKRPGDLSQIPIHLSCGTGTSGQIRIVAAPAWIHGCHKLEISRIAARSINPGDSDLALLQRLPQGLQGSPAHFRKLVQKQDPSRSQGYLPGLWPAPSAGQGLDRYRMMGRPEGPSPDQRLLPAKKVADTVYF